MVTLGVTIIIVYIIGSSLMVLLCIYYYMLIAIQEIFEINSLKNQLSGVFDMKDLGVAKKILGMKIHREQRQTNCTWQKEYWEDAWVFL